MPKDAGSHIVAIVLTINQRAKTLRCLASLQAVSWPGFEIVVWDNGSSDGTRDAIISQFPKVHYHWHPLNLGAAQGRNAGVEFVKSRLSNPASEYLFLDNDTEVTPRFLANLVQPLREHNSIAQTTAKILFMQRPDVINVAGGANIRFWRGTTRPIGYGEPDRGQYDQPFDCIAGTGCTLVRASAFHALNGFDSAFDPYGLEDLDFSARIVRAGHRCVYVPDAVIYHDPTQTFGQGEYTAAYAEKKAENWRRFLARHGRFHQKVLFYAIGFPLAATSTVFRLLRQGNFGAIAGLVRGAVRRTPRGH